MQDITPDYSLILWTLFSLAGIGIMVFALIRLLTIPGMDTMMKILWFVFIVFIPLIGALAFLLYGKQYGRINPDSPRQ
ncbi:MAG: PLDc N-terminal domain-containing protein [Bacteroidota bacterium]